MTTLAGDLYLLLAALGLALSASYAGLPVLGHGAFMALGAFGVVHLDRAGWPLGIAVLGAVVLAAVTGYGIGYGAARLHGAFLALATWALAWLAYAVLVAFPAISGGSQGLTRQVPARLVFPSLGMTVTFGPTAHAAVAALLCVAAMAALARGGRGPGALDLAAMRTGPAVADSLGVPVARRRRTVLATTAAAGALAGAGSAVLYGVVAPADYSPLLSLQLLAAVLIGGTARWWGPAVGVAVLAALPMLADNVAGLAGTDPERVRVALSAALLVAVLLLRRAVGGLVDRVPGRPRRPPAVPASAEGRLRDPVAPGFPLLEAHGLSLSYGAVQALAGVDVTARAGEVVAVVGPNGSGKSTLLRVLAGAIAPDAGSVLIGGSPRPVPRSQAECVRAGVARTYQKTALLPRLTPLEQVAVGVRGGERTSYAALRHLAGTPSSRPETAQRTALAIDTLAVCGLSERAGAATSTLTGSEQRLLQVARVVATGAGVLLLDEPAAGMSAGERGRLGTLLRRLADGGRAVVLVEHDMVLVGRVADRVTVLADGRVLASGTPPQVRADPAVRRAYLGIESAVTEEA